MTIASEYVLECAEVLAHSARPPVGRGHPQPSIALMGGRIEDRQHKREPHHMHPSLTECELGTPNVNPCSALSSTDLPHLQLHSKPKMSGSEVLVGKSNSVSKMPVPNTCQQKFLTATVLIDELTPRVIKATVEFGWSE